MQGGHTILVRRGGQVCTIDIIFNNAALKSRCSYLYGRRFLAPDRHTEIK